MKSLKPVSAIALAVLAISASIPHIARGVDEFQGPINHYWQRGAAGTTYQAWEWNSDPVGNDQVAPEHSLNPYGSPKASVPNDYAHDNYWYWEPVDCPSPLQQPPCHALRASPMLGYKSITFTIPNSPNTGKKWIQIQSTDTAMMADSVKVAIVDSLGHLVQIPVHYKDREVRDWNRSDHMWTIATVYELDTNPNFEIIDVSWPADTLVEEVVIDTICWGETNPPVDIEKTSWGGIKSLFR